MIYLVTGGSGSGKSAYAEGLVSSSGIGERFYIATMFPYDEESKKRVLRHQKMRADRHFKTLECFTDLEKIEVPKGSIVLLECMSNLLANEMYMPQGAGDLCVKAILSGVKRLENKVETLIIVTNEVFSDGGAYDAETLKYIHNLGEINKKVQEMADAVVEVVYGIPVWMKGRLS